MHPLQPPGPLGLFVTTQRTEWSGKEDLTGSLTGVGVLVRAHGGPSLCGRFRLGTLHVTRACSSYRILLDFLSLMKLFFFPMPQGRSKFLFYG